MKEEPKQEIDMSKYIVGIDPYDKQETLSEAAERVLANNIDGLKDALQDDDLFFFYKGVIQCYGEAMAKWQQERIYSEEDLRNAFFSFPDEWICFEEWFEQFKKK